MKKDLPSLWQWVLPIMLLIFNLSTSIGQSATTNLPKSNNNEIAISITGIEYDDPAFIALKESIKKNGKVIGLKQSYSAGIAKISLQYSGDATELWDQLPATVKQPYKLSAIDDKRVTLELKKTTKQSESVVNSSSTAKTSTHPTATFEDIWIDYNVEENGLYGMRIHVKFKTYNMKDLDSYLAIYFEKKNGEKLFTNNTAYRSKGGQVAVFRSLKPAYQEAIYNDLQLFMPYNELNLGKGTFDLKMDVDVIYKNGDMLKHLGYKEFRFSQ